MSGAISPRRPYEMTAFTTLTLFTKDTCTVHAAAGPRQLLVSHTVYINSETALPALSAQKYAQVKYSNLCLHPAHKHLTPALFESGKLLGWRSGWPRPADPVDPTRAADTFFAARYTKAQRVDHERKGWLFRYAPCCLAKDAEAIQST